MQANVLTYPECVPPKWGLAAPFGHRTMLQLLRKSMTSPKGTPRDLAYRATIAAVNTLHERGIRTFRGDKVLKLLIQAAREHGWLKRSGGQYKAVPKAQKPDHKVCRKCQEEKPDAEYRIFASAAQKKRNGWAEDRQQYTYAVICAHCRKLKQQRERRKEVKRQDPDTYGAYRNAFANELGAVKRLLKTHLTIELPDGSKAYQFDHEADQTYYFERERLIELARRRFENAVNAGDLLSVVDLSVPKGAWYGLLTQDERDGLARIHRDGSWAGSTKKGRVPKLWEKVVVPRKKPKTVAYTPSTEPKVEPPPEILFGKQPDDPSKFDPELGF